VTIYLDGTWDGTGAIAFAAGIGTLLFGCAYILLTDPAIRRIVALLMVISSMVLLVCSAIGFTRVAETIGPNPLLPGAEGQTPFEATVAIGLAMSLASGIIATVASVLLVARREAGLEEPVEISAAATACASSTSHLRVALAPAWRERPPR
jgi:hypothetical protein